MVQAFGEMGCYVKSSAADLTRQPTLLIGLASRNNLTIPGALLAPRTGHRVDFAVAGVEINRGVSVNREREKKQKE